MQSLGIIIAPRIKTPSALYSNLDLYFFYFPVYDHLLCLDNPIMKSIANDYHFDYKPVMTNSEIISKSDFLFIFGGDILPTILVDLVKYKKKCLIIN